MGAFFALAMKLAGGILFDVSRLRFRTASARFREIPISGALSLTREVHRCFHIAAMLLVMDAPAKVKRRRCRLALEYKILGRL